MACGARPPPVVETQNADRDEDTLHDEGDACPDEPEDLDGRHDEDGCPDLDDDADGIADADDRCVCDAEDRDGWEDADGCPETDNDQDRIVDVCDRCPNDPETYNGGCDEDGCPDYGRVCIEQSSIRILQYVYFRRGRAEITRESFPLLDAIAETMAGNPQITLIAVIGQADPHERQPEALALRRAEAVLEALVTRGTPRDRLVARAGTGASVVGLPPEQQRRVQLAVLAIDGVALDVDPEAVPLPEPESNCSSRAQTSCEVPVCAPVVTPPAC
jgi:OmpA-OmpF porin, OOP family